MRLLVSVDSPSGRHLVSLPDDAAVGDLLPGIVRECEAGGEPAGWSLAPQGEAEIPAGRTLAEVGLFAGAILVLTPPGPAVETPVAPRPPRLERMGDRDYARTLDAAIQASRAPASTVVAVAGAQAGAGATTVAALVAMALAALRDEDVVAVDANPGSGALSHWLVPDAALPNDVYAALFREGATPADVDSALVSAGGRLAVFPAPHDPSTALPGDWDRLLEHLRRMHHRVVVDCGIRAGGGWADSAVLVTRFGQEAPPGAGVVVVNQAPHRARMRGRQVTLPAEPQAGLRLKRRGFAWADAPPSWQLAIRELAAMLLGGAEPRPRAMCATPSYRPSAPRASGTVAATARASSGRSQRLTCGAIDHVRTAAPVATSAIASTMSRPARPAAP